MYSDLIPPFKISSPMQTQSFSFPKPLNPPLTSPFTKPPHSKSLTLIPSLRFPKPISLNHRNVLALAGRSKKPAGGSPPGRIEGGAEVRREAKRNARRKIQKLAESLFYRLKNPHRNYADNFSEEELQMIGLGYDRMVRFMEKDDPNLRHPYDWYKYGEFGPYSWRGIVLGDPIRGGLTDECVTLIGEVKDQEEWEKIEQHEMAIDFGERLDSMDKSAGFRYFWVFVRHPKWRLNELPWQQWTLVCEVVLQAGKQRLDKWSLMGRLGNKTRSLITQCAAWMRPDIIYVQRPVYQCRFEPQDDFFRALTPLLDPKTEGDFLFELVHEDGRVEVCTYFSGLCKIVKMNPKAFVDDVVKAYEKLSDEGKSRCLEFLLGNHPVELLHPYTKEWKAKLEEMELGCDAPDDDEEVGVSANSSGEMIITDWIEDDGDDGDTQSVIDIDDGDDGDDKDDQRVIGVGDDTELGIKEEDSSPDESEEYWDNEFRMAMSSNEAMEDLARRSVERTTELYKTQIKAMEEEKGKGKKGEYEMRGKRPKVSQQEWKIAGYGPFRRRIKKSKIPPELFLQAAVRPFTYQDLVKEIVLTRHAILDGEIGRKD